MENSPQNYFKVGLFLTVGLVAILVSILLLGGDRAILKNHVSVYAVMDNVQGLNKGSVVSVSGFVVGNIKEISFSPEKKALVVEMKIQQDYIHRITKGSIADIRTQGALGDKYIYISPGLPTDTPLNDGDYIETSKSADLMDIISQKAGEAGKIFEIIEEVHKLAKIINADGRSEKIITNIVEASQNFKVTSEETKKLVSEIRNGNTEKLKETIQHLNNVMAKLDKGEGTLGALINDPSLHERLKAIIGADSRKQSMQSLIRDSIEKSKP